MTSMTHMFISHLPTLVPTVYKSPANPITHCLKIIHRPCYLRSYSTYSTYKRRAELPQNAELPKKSKYKNLVTWVCVSLFFFPHVCLLCVSLFLFLPLLWLSCQWPSLLGLKMNEAHSLPSRTLAEGGKTKRSGETQRSWLIKRNPKCDEFQM